jgi:predicted transcriptional regulator
MKYRSRTDIIALVLRSALNGGQTKTRLMYNAYLSYNQLKEYLAFLQERGLLTYEEGTQLYRTTEKSLEFLEACEKMESLTALEEGGKVEAPVASKVRVARYQY